MKTKTAMILILLASTLMLAAPVTARAIEDEWFIDKAITNVVEDHEELAGEDIVWNGVVTSGYELHFRPFAPVHKHASIVGSFGFANSGYVEWDGRVYLNPRYGVYEMNYIYKKPDHAILTTTVKNARYKYLWDGNEWVENTPTITVIDGRTWVIYPKP